jgi:hypothetical protein
MPKAFLSYAFEDRDLAKHIAEGLMANGVDTWWAEWEIGSGDSLRRKIEEGLTKCTHFIVLLTTTSINKPWVNQEMDAGLVRKIEERCRFIPLRHGLAAKDLPPLLSGMLAPEIDANCTQLPALINEIHGVTRKPALGPAPVTKEIKTGYSVVATLLAKIFVTQSALGVFADPQYDEERLVSESGLTDEEVRDALYELRDFFKESHFSAMVQSTLFAEFDKFWKPWDPEKDALRLAADLVNDDDFPHAPEDIAARYEWEPRRLNPAIAYLSSRRLVTIMEGFAHPYETFRVSKTDATRRFVKSRG